MRSPSVVLGQQPVVFHIGLQLACVLELRFTVTGQSMPPTQPGALSCCCVEPAACAVQHWLATSLCFGASLHTYVANPCHLLTQVRSPAALLGQQPVLCIIGLQLACVLELLFTVTWPIHATYSARCALLLV